MARKQNTNLELVKTCKYVDLDVFELGKLYYVVCKDDKGKKSAIATCIMKTEKCVTLKYIEKITGNWKLFEDVLVVEPDILSVKGIEIQPFYLRYHISALNRQLNIRAYVEYEE